MGAEPFFFSHAKEKNSGETFARIMNIFVAVCMSAFLVVMLFLDLFKWFIPNPAYHEGLRVVPILMLANVFLGIYYNQSVWYKLTDRTRVGGTIAIIGAAITIAFNFALIPVLGYMGSAWATLACYAGMAVISYAWGQKHYPIPYNVSGCWGTWPVAACLVGVRIRSISMRSSGTGSVREPWSASCWSLGSWSGIHFRTLLRTATRRS
ncbi:MAG: polysaccharide biosynthesis C-terminal domain-containing protein [Flavobacteriales bacterium]|nr:polysaccharide biosynthesis C-terminal domain-containing protein [Flavobacteriales bacterium]